MIQERRKRSYNIFDRPFVLFMGPQRAGTSWLDRYLRARKDVCLPSDVKEVFFFDRDFDKGIRSYTAHFDPEPTHKIISEISTTSFDHKDAPKRVYDVFGSDVQLVCPLRNPIVRSYSLYLHYVRYGIVTGSLKDACAQNPQILESSYYADNLNRWVEYYDLDQIHILFQEELESDQDGFIQKVCDVLQIPYIKPQEELRARYNVTTYSKSGVLAGLSQKAADWCRQNRLYALVNMAKCLGMKRVIFGKENPDAARGDIPEEDYAFLQEKLGGEIKKLESLLGREMTVWK